jgi:nucleoside-diphosphate-sugar epimerase
MTTVAVTGGAGFVGKRVCLALRMAGLDPFVIDPNYRVAMDCDGRACMIEDVRSIGRSHAIIHLASPVGTLGVVEQRGRVAARIVSAAHAALDLAMTSDCPLVNVSTSEVYGIQPGTDTPIAETAGVSYPPRWSARLAYGIGKLAAENDLHTSDHRTAVVTVRPFNIAGPGQDPALGFVIPRMIDQVLAGEPITVFGRGMLRRCFMHVDDLAQLLVLLVGVRKADGMILNAAGPLDNEVTIRELARLVQERTERILGATSPISFVDGKTVFGPDWEEAAAGSKVGDSTLAQELVGWKSETPLAAIVDDVIHDRAHIEASVQPRSA